MRRFETHRSEDVSGTSGVGVVADGVCFDDGTCVMKWRGIMSSVAIYRSPVELEAIHGHEGRTQIVWLDPASL